MGVYQVQSNGKAQAGLSVGDHVVTGGGTYQINGVNADGTYQSSKVSDTTTSNYTGKYDSLDNSSIVPSVQSFVSQARSLNQENNAIAQANAREQWDFNASEALKNRTWQEYMSNTAHQRELADLKAAGLNPVLTAMGGNGAAVSSGATAAGALAGVDESGASVLGNLLGTIVGARVQLANADLNAKTQLANAAINADLGRAVAQINATASMYGADKNYKAKEDFPSTVEEVGARQLNAYVNSVEGALTGGSVSSASTAGKFFDKLANGIINFSNNLINSGRDKYK